MNHSSIANRRTFGPVPSRRLGRSLGVDLVPLKTCTYDCVYCQLGRTTCKTVERKEWVPLQEVLDEVKERIQTQPDYITLSGSGEPTLFTPIDKLIAGIRTFSDIPIAVLTNGALLGNAEVQRELLGADLVVPSLDAGNESVFQRINRPHPSISFERMFEGLKAFRCVFRGQYWLEVFLLGDMPADAPEIADLRRCIEAIRPDRVQLNTVTRPPAEEWAVAILHSRLQEIAESLGPTAEVIAEFRGAFDSQSGQSNRDDILQILVRRPCTIDDIAGGLNMHRVEVMKHMEHLLSEKLVKETYVGDKRYYGIIAPRLP